MSRVARATCGAALGAALMSTLALPVDASEWTFAPTLTWLADTDSNRYLQAQSVASQSTSLFAAAELKRATETTQFSFSPQLHWQLFDRKEYGNIFERDLDAAWTWTGERGNASVTAADTDHSTLTTEATQTGVLSTNLHQRQDQASVSSLYDQSERYALIVQLGYSNVSYYGAGEGALLDLLQGYRYPTAMVGERYQISDLDSLTASVYRDEVLARFSGNDTDDTGAQLAYRRTLSERDALDAALGAARVQTATGTQTATTGSLDVSRSYSLGTLTLAYSRSLVPYGTGVLVDRQQLSLSASRGLTEELQLNASASWVSNGQPLGRAPGGGLILEVQAYEAAQVGLTWQPAETWKLDADLAATRTRTIEEVSEPVHEWRAGISISWAPHALDSAF